MYKGFGPNEKRKEFLLVKKSDSVYTTAGVIEAGKLNIGLEFFDRQNLSQNKNGIYSAKAKLNGLEIFSLLNLITFSVCELIKSPNASISVKSTLLFLSSYITAFSN